jgi:hypothetical protein
MICKFYIISFRQIINIQHVFQTKVDHNNAKGLHAYHIQNNLCGSATPLFLLPTKK